MTTIRESELVTAVGGLCFERYGVATLRRGPVSRGGEEFKEAHTRAVGANAGYYMDRDGILRKAGTDKLRPYWIDADLDGTREAYLLSEPVRTNLCLRSEEFDNATWAKTRATITANADTAPDGAATADRLVEDATATQSHFVNQAIVVSAGATCAVSVYAKAGTRSWVLLRFQDAASTNRVDRYFNLATGAMGTASVAGTGTSLFQGVEPVGNGWYRLTLVGNLGGVITGGFVTIFLATGDNGAVYSGDGASYVSVWGAQLEDNQFNSTSYILTTGATQARAADKLSFTFNRPPMAMSLYTVVREVGLISYTAISARLWQIGQSAGSNRVLSLRVNAGTGKYQCAHAINAGSEVNASLAVAPVYGDYVELLTTLNADGSVQIAQSINKGAVTQSAVSGAKTLATAWGDTNLLIGGTSLATGNDTVSNHLRLLAIARGADKTIPDFRAYFGV